MKFAENNRISHRQLFRQIIVVFPAPFLLCLFKNGAMLGKIKKAVSGKDESDTKKLLELLMDTWIDEVENELKENAVYQKMLEKISKYEDQVQAMGLEKEKRKMIDAYVTKVNERWILYAESLYQAGMQKILELLNL